MDTTSLHLDKEMVHLERRPVVQLQADKGEKVEQDEVDLGNVI